jgi:hypothetical protein
MRNRTRITVLAALPLAAAFAALTMSSAAAGGLAGHDWGDSVLTGHDWGDLVLTGHSWSGSGPAGPDENEWFVIPTDTPWGP